MDKPKDITIYDIAKALKMSPSTVSRGLKDHPEINRETKKKILQMAKQMEYQFNTFASNLRKQRTNTIGVMVPKLNSFFVSSVLAGMEKVASEKGYNLIISQSLESVSKEITNAKTMFHNRVEGLLISLSFDTTNIDHLSDFIKKGIPVIFFDRIYDHPECPSIVIDNYKNSYDLTKHLIEQGSKHIAHVTGNQLRNVYKERCAGYRRALADFGIPYDESLLMITEMNEEAGIEAANKILAMPVKPDGIFFSNDLTAATAMHVLKQAGIKVPQDIAIAGFNNELITRVVDPNITTVNYPSYDMGVIAATNLINYLNDTSPKFTASKIVLRSELIIRASSLRKK